MNLLAMTVTIDASWPAVVVAAIGLIGRYLPERRRSRRPVRVAVIRPARGRSN